MGTAIAFRSVDYRRVCIVSIESVGELTDDFHKEFPDMYSFAIPWTGYRDKVIIPTTEFNRYLNKIRPLFYDIDIDIPPDIKNRIREYLQQNPQDEEFRRGLLDYKRGQIKAILPRLSQLTRESGIIPVFSNTTTFFHILIPARGYIEYRVWLVPEAWGVFQTEWKGWADRVISLIPNTHTDPYHIHTKTFRTELIDPTANIDPEAIRYFTEKLQIHPTSKENKNIARFHDILPVLVEYFKTRTYPYTETFGGEHHSLIKHLAGELALSGWTLDEALEIYRHYFQPYDNPRDYNERIYNIKRTFQRVANKEPVQALRHVNWAWCLASDGHTERITIPTAKEIRERGATKVYYPTPKGVAVRYVRKGKNKIDKDRLLSWRWNISIIKFQDQFIEYKLYNPVEAYTVKSPIPNTQQNIREFEHSIAHIPLTRREISKLKDILNNAVVFKEVWKAPTENKYNETTATTTTNTGLVDAIRLWRTNQAYRLGISISIAKYQNPHIPNPILWVYGMTGVGKSYTLSAIARAFGVRVFQNATYSALETFAGTLKNEPLIIEDLTPFIDHTEEIRDLIFTGHLGLGRARRTNIAGSSVIYSHSISSSILLASEIPPQAFFTQGTVGVFRRILTYRLTQVPILDISQGEGWATLLNKIEPNPIDYQDIPYKQHHIKALIPYLRAIYRVLNEMAGTDFNADLEIKQATETAEQKTREIIHDKIRKWVISEFLKRGANRVIQLEDMNGERVVMPTVFIHDMSREIGIDPDTILEITKWRRDQVKIKGKLIEVFDVSDWIN